MEQIIFILEIIGTVAFALSGVFVAIESGLDLFGIAVLAITTATGGGMIRDVMLGKIPPASLINPVYGLVSLGSALCAAIFYKIIKNRLDEKTKHFITWSITISDAIGLGVFTVISAEMASELYPNKLYMIVFLSVIAAVGGGMMRDVLAGKMPIVLRKEVYALLSITGSIVYVFLSNFLSPNVSMIVVSLLIASVRIYSVKRHLNLPKLDK